MAGAHRSNPHINKRFGFTEVFGNALKSVHLSPVH